MSSAVKPAFRYSSMTDSVCLMAAELKPPHKEELEEYKEKDPIDHVLNILKTQYKVKDEQVNEIVERVRKEVEESVQFAEESPWPDDNELLKDVYAQEDYPFLDKLENN